MDTNDTHTLIIGATRSGKTRRLIFPTIWELGKAGESMVLTDPKGELYERSRDYLKSQGYNIVLLDFRNPRRGNYWNPIHPVAQAVSRGDYSEASEMAWDIAHMVVHQKPHTGDPLWPNGEESVIAAMILLTVLEAPEERFKHMGTAYSILYSLGAAEEDGKLPLNDYIASLPAGHLSKAAYGTALLAPYRTRASFFTGASADLRLWADPSIVHLTSCQDHELNMPGREKTAVFLCIPDEKGTRHVLASLYVDQIYQALVDLATREGGRLPVRVNFLLDEFGNSQVSAISTKNLPLRWPEYSVCFSSAGRCTAKTALQGKRTDDHWQLSYMGVSITADAETAKLISGNR